MPQSHTVLARLSSKNILKQFEKERGNAAKNWISVMMDDPSEYIGTMGSKIFILRLAF